MPPRRLSPTLAAAASGCPHTWSLEVFGDPEAKREPEAGKLLQFERGRTEEEARVKTLAGVVSPVWKYGDWETGLAKTVALMEAGNPWIYQGVLLDSEMSGMPDLLRKVDRPSKLGPHSYEPVDVKGHKEVTKKDRIQLCAYARMLEPVLGSRPSRGAIWLNTDVIEDVDLAAEKKKFETLVRLMLDVREGKTKTQGLRCTECRNCLWSDVCGAEWKASDNTCLLYGVTSGTAKKLQDAGLKSWRDVAAITVEDLAKRMAKPAEKVKSIWSHAKAWLTGEPQVVAAAKFPSVPVIFWDIETFEGTTYLHGLVRVYEGKREERQFFAEKPDQEGRIWLEFLDYLAKDAQALVWCWASYEMGFAKSLYEEYGGNPAGWKHLEHALHDQCAWTKKHFALPVSSYSIKKVAPVFGFAWDAADAGGLNSEAWYRDWLEKGDPAMKAKLLRYNLDDVRAMEAIDIGLRSAAGHP